MAQTGFHNKRCKHRTGGVIPLISFRPLGCWRIPGGMPPVRAFFLAGCANNFGMQEFFLTFAVQNMVDVVQLVEHRIVVPSVVGSSPIIHPSSNPY